MNILLYAGSVVAEKLREKKRTRTMKSEKNLSGRQKFRQIVRSGEKMSVDYMKGGKAHLNLKGKTLIEWKESTN